MPMLRASIYNPALGEGEDIEPQLILHYGNDEKSEQLKQIGIAQGLAELSHSVDGNPVSWVKTSFHLLVLLRVEPSSAENWRNGYWLFATVDLDEFPQFVLYSIRDAYHRFCLLNGSLQYCIDNNIDFKQYWTEFFASWSPEYAPGALAGPRYLRLVSGVLSPDIIGEIESIREDHGFKDILISSIPDYSFFWPGKHLDLGVRVDIQNLLLYAPIVPKVDDPAQHSGSLNGSTTSLNPQPSNSSGSVSGSIHRTSTPDANIGDVTQEHITLLSEIHTGSGGAAPSPPPQSNGFFSDMSSYLPNISYMNSGNLPLPSNASSMFSRSLPSMPHMPQLPTFDSFKKPFESFGNYFGGQGDTDKATAPPISRVIHSMRVMIGDKEHYLMSYQKDKYVFTFISSAEVTWNPHLERSCTLLSRDLEGMSFAADPPNQFNYLVLNSSKQTITSTIPFPTSKEEHHLHELITRTLISSQEGKNEVMRTSSNWWVQHTIIDDNMEIILCSKCANSDISEFIGAHKATDDWVLSYRRRRGCK